jgi:acetyl-CoA decarbonylase/synthase complex subunit gamma
MGLTALEVYKHLPKTNCRKCGFGTCLAFAMQLAANKVSLEKCPEIDEGAKAKLESATRPPIKPIKIGGITIGGETVLFRHEKKFFNPTAIAVIVEDNDGCAEEKIKKIKEYKFSRVGEEYFIDMIAVKGSDQKRFLEVVRSAKQTGLPMLLIAEDSSLQKALEVCGDTKPVLCYANLSNIDKMAELAKKYGCSVVANASNLDELCEITEKLEARGVEKIILHPEQKTLKQTFHNLTIIRRAAINQKNKNLGYPVLTFPHDDIEASIHILKYASIIALDNVDSGFLDGLFTLRQAIYTDPQKPLQVEPKVYELNNPDSKSPVVITTNFSLTYFTVSADIESTKQPCHLLIVETEGQSVLTAFASGKFSAESIAKAIKSSKIMESISHKKVVIPGLVSMLKGEIEELSGLNVLVGPQNSSDLKTYLVNLNDA